MEAEEEEEGFIKVCRSKKRRVSESMHEIRKTGTDSAKVQISSGEFDICKTNPVKVANFINSKIGEYEKIVPMGKSLKVICSYDRAKALLNLKTMFNKPITVKLITTSKLTKGIIHGVSIEMSTDDLITNIQSDTKVTNVKRLREGHESIIISFESEKIPDRIKIGYRSYKVNLFIPRDIF